MAAAVATSGCAQVQDAFRSGGSSVAASAGSATLTPEQLGNLLGAAKGVQLDTAAAALVANLWVDQALFAQAVAAKKPLTDSATAAKALWPAIWEIKAQRWHDTVIARLAPVAAGTVDSIYNAGETRVIQHILVKTNPGQDAEAKAQATKLLADIKGGANFGALAAKFSADPGSARDNGFLPPSGRGAYVPAFEQAGWSLAPGAVSGLVKTEFGYHILRRPPLDEVRGRLEAMARMGATQKADSTFMADLTSSKKIEVVKDAPARMKAALANRAGSVGSKTALVTYTGGPFTVGRFLEWAATAPPQFAQQIAGADSAQLTQFAKMLATNEIVVAQADSAKIGLSTDEWAQLYQSYKDEVDSAAAGLGLAPDSDAKAAGAAVTALFEKVVVGQARLRPLPQALGSVLRAGARSKVNPSGLGKALEIAKSLQAKNGGAPGQMMQPAPGPAPVPGGAAPAAPEAAPAAPAPKP